MIATPASEIIIIIALMLACYMSLLHVTFLNTCLSCDGIFKMYHNVTSIDNYCWGKFFFLLFFVFSLTCYCVFFSFSLSGIFLIMLLCYVLYVNFVIVYYLALIYYQFYGSISVTTFVEVGFFLGGPDHQPCIPQHLVSSFVFIVFSLISFCSRLKVVFLYCNYYFFAFCRNLLFYGFLVKHLLIESLRVVFWNWPLPVHFVWNWPLPVQLLFAMSHPTSLIFLIPHCCINVILLCIMKTSLSKEMCRFESGRCMIVF